jgi:membrane fusion protein, copper/silver efflux system
MKKVLLFSVVSFLLGAALIVLGLVNPFHWGWLTALREAPAMAASGAGTAGAPAPTTRTIKYWRAPMDPTYIRDKPGKSPMGMDLVPVYEDEADSAPGIVTIDPGFVQNMGVQSAPVVRTDIPFTIRTVGTLTYNDSQIALVTTKYEGWIEKVYVNYVGQPVKKGDDLFEVYSPDLVSTQQEYLHALDYAAQMKAGGFADMANRAASMLEAARQRLKYWDVTDEQIAELERSRTPRRTLAVVAAKTGVVVWKMDDALEGMYVHAGMNLYKIADLSTIWCDVDVFENQVPWLRLGQAATLTLSYEPGRTYTGRIRYLYPYLAEKTRALKASIELPNRDGKLRVGMYANVTFDVPAAHQVLAVPEEAVIRSGTRNILVLDRGHGTFQVRQVTLGVNGSGLWQVTSGVEPGDRVVVSAQFLIDSESNLREAIRKISSGDSGTTDAGGGGDAPPMTMPGAAGGGPAR